MARIRTIKPEFFRHEGLQDLEIANPGSYSMLVFAGLWGHCDRAGRFVWKPRHLKLDILPFIEFNMANTLAILEAAGFLRRYVIDGNEYGEIKSFDKHQRIGGKEAQEPAKHPEPPDNKQGSNGEALGKQQGLQEGKGREEEKEGKGIKPLSVVESVGTPTPFPQKPETHPAPTRQGIVCGLLRKAGMADAAPHYLADDTWAVILGKRTDEQIVELAKAKMAAKPNHRIGLKYIAPALLQDPDPLLPGARASPINGKTKRTINGRQAAIDNYAAQAAEARGESNDRITSGERDITGEAIRVA